MIYTTSKIFLAVKCSSNNNWSVSSCCTIFSNASNNFEQSSLCGPGIGRRFVNDQCELKTIHTKVICHGKKDVLLLWTDAVSSNWRFINRNTVVLLSRAISGGRSQNWPLICRRMKLHGGNENDMDASPNLQDPTIKCCLEHTSIEFKLRKNPANCELNIRTCSHWSEAQNCS